MRLLLVLAALIAPLLVHAQAVPAHRGFGVGLHAGPALTSTERHVELRGHVPVSGRLAVLPSVLYLHRPAAEVPIYCVTTPCLPQQVEEARSLGLGVGLVGSSGSAAVSGLGRIRSYVGMQMHYVARSDSPDRGRIALLLGSAFDLGRGFAVGLELQGAAVTHTDGTAFDDPLSLTPLLHLTVGR